MSLVPTASAGSVTTLRDEVYAYMALTSRDISRLRTDISEESAKRAFFEAYIRTQLDRHRPVTVTPPAVGGSGTSVTGWNLAEVAPMPNVVEVAEPAPVTPLALNVAEVAPTDTRVTTAAQAIPNIGQICKYTTGTDVWEYGRILGCNAVDLYVDRLQQTATGAFIFHPHPHEFPRGRVGYTRPSVEVRILPGAIGPDPLLETIPPHDPLRGVHSLKKGCLAPPAVGGGGTVTPPVTDDKDRRIAELERKVALLTEAVTMFLAMKSATEHYAVTRAEEAIVGYHRTHGFPASPVCLPTGPSFQLCGWGTPVSTTTSRAEWYAAMEELQTATVKTDTLLAALTE